VGKTGKPKTQTTPKGTEIPVPKRGEFMRDLAKVAGQNGSTVNPRKRNTDPSSSGR
jgi:hypothetical protein